MSTKIEWTDKTWNPIIGCSKISDGCKNCYAEKFANRLSGQFMDYGLVIDNGKWNGHTVFREKELNKPFHWKKPRMIFVCSMGDLFHESIPHSWIHEVFGVIQNNPNHTFQILTKRPDNALKFFEHLGNVMKNGVCKIDFIPISNLWIGVTVENDKNLHRIEDLLKIPAKVHFVSAEPLLSEIILSDEEWFNYLEGYETQMRSQGNMPMETRIETNKIDWVIAGRETGPGARPMKREWIESLYEQSKAAGVPFFDKRDELGLNLKEYPK